MAARQADADCIVSIGGGSAIDSGKGIVLIHTVGADYRSYSPELRRGSPLPELAHGSYRHSDDDGLGERGCADLRAARSRRWPRKCIFRDTRLIPSVAILDPR